MAMNHTEEGLPSKLSNLEVDRTEKKHQHFKEICLFQLIPRWETLAS